MDDPCGNRMREVPQTFRAANEAEALFPRPATYRVKVFKSGNSLALRLPKALGLEAGMEMEVRTAADGTYALRRSDAPARKIDGSKFIGKCPGLAELPRHEFDDSPRDWHLLDRPVRPA